MELWAQVDGGTPTLVIEKLQPPSYSEGELLSLSVLDASGGTVVDWKQRAHFARTRLGGPNCDPERYCVTYHAKGGVGRDGVAATVD